MKAILILFFLTVTNQCFSQKNAFDTLKIDATTKIIGRYPQYDKRRTYEKYNFIIEDPIEIARFIKSIKLGSEVENSMEDPCFTLTIVKAYDEMVIWTVNPTLKSVMTGDGHTYKFDLDQISKLNEKYPFKYNFDVKSFKSKYEFETYLAEQKNNPNFLFYYAPQFKYEGSFDIEFKKSSKFPHPKGISEYMEPYIEKLVSKDEYSFVYNLNEKNMKFRDQYTMTLSGPKKLFTDLKIDDLKNENWQPTEEEGFFFYKKQQ